MQSKLLIVVAALCFGLCAQVTRPDEQLPVEVKLKMLAMEQQANVVKSSSTEAAKAEAWYQLQLAAEELARAIEKAYPPKSGTGERDLDPGIIVSERVQESGVSVFYCDAMQRWAAGVEGYEKYLELQPNGPRAEESMWRGMLDQRDVSCSGYEGFDEENAEQAELYRKFLTRFPHGVHVAQARKRLTELEALIGSQGR